MPKNSAPSLIHDSHPEEAAHDTLRSGIPTRRARRATGRNSSPIKLSCTAWIVLTVIPCPLVGIAQSLSDAFQDCRWIVSKSRARVSCKLAPLTAQRTSPVMPHQCGWKTVQDHGLPAGRYQPTREGYLSSVRRSLNKYDGEASSTLFSLRRRPYHLASTPCRAIRLVHEASSSPLR